jgi:hypothetical protein
VPQLEQRSELAPDGIVLVEARPARARVGLPQPHEGRANPARPLLEPAEDREILIGAPGDPVRPQDGQARNDELGAVFWDVLV